MLTPEILKTLHPRDLILLYALLVRINSSAEADVDYHRGEIKSLADTAPAKDLVAKLGEHCENIKKITERTPAISNLIAEAEVLLSEQEIDVKAPGGPVESILAEFHSMFELDDRHPDDHRAGAAATGETRLIEDDLPLDGQNNNPVGRLDPQYDAAPGKDDDDADDGFGFGRRTITQEEPAASHHTDNGDTHDRGYHGTPQFSRNGGGLIRT
ncbi:MAG: hypothetical protein EPN75_08770 [Beijerinckiaceae bacterium]|nr:MAG: hypothetical protein EPN75_08770 [Beijerinckiaceae bacterium]